MRPSAFRRLAPLLLTVGTVLITCGCREPSSDTTVTVRKEPPPVDFALQVLPVLSENCFFCHGPDRAQVAADLSLHTFEYATAELSSGVRAIVPGASGQSEMWRRINDVSYPMPPVDSHKSLTREEIALIGRWINEGAVYTEHWAYRALSDPKPPQVNDVGWTRNNIDRFILSRVEKAGLTPGKPAARQTLARRVHLDLVGSHQSHMTTSGAGRRARGARTEQRAL